MEIEEKIMNITAEEMRLLAKETDENLKSVLDEIHLAAFKRRVNPYGRNNYRV